MELPPYHIPALLGCLEHVWYNLKSFVVRAGKVILLIAVALSLASGAFEAAGHGDGNAAVRRSAAGALSRRRCAPWASPKATGPPLLDWLPG
jgi:ferrous iron transport protein B